MKSHSLKSQHEVSSHPVILLKENLHDERSVDPVYQAKARILNQALQEIGMGKYQVRIPSDFLGDYICFGLVGSIHCCGFWMVRVSS